MKAIVTGGAGFLGTALVRQLRARGDEVTTLVRNPARSDALRELGCTVIEADLGTMPVDRLAATMDGASALFHLAGSYRVGIPASEHAPMFAANVVATRATLDAARTAGVARSVYASTVNVFGDTDARVVDETYVRPQPAAFLSYYDETKYLAHLAAEERIAAGAPILIAMPGMVYGPGDPSHVGTTIRQAMAGRLPVLALLTSAATSSTWKTWRLGCCSSMTVAAWVRPMCWGVRSRPSASSCGAPPQCPAAPSEAHHPLMAPPCPGAIRSAHRPSPGGRAEPGRGGPGQ